MRNGFAADETTLVEEPGVFTVKFLERIVGQHRGVGLVGDAEHECVAPPNGAGRRRDQFVVRDASLKLWHLALVDSVAKRCVDNDGNSRIRMLLHEASDCLAQLGKARQRPAFSCKVGTVDHDVFRPLLGSHPDCHFLSCKRRRADMLWSPGSDLRDARAEQSDRS